MSGTLPVTVCPHAIFRAWERAGLAGLRMGEVRRVIRQDVREALHAGRVTTLVPEEVARDRTDLERPPGGCWYAWRPSRDRFYVLRLNGARWIVKTVLVPEPCEEAA